MSCGLQAYRDSDLKLSYVFPDGVSFTGYDASFVVYDERGGAALLAVGISPTGNNSQITFASNAMTLLVKSADIDLLPENTDATMPSLLYFDLILTGSDDLATKIQGGILRVMPRGSTVCEDGYDISVSLDGDIFSVVVLSGPSYSIDSSVSSFGAALVQSPDAASARGVIGSPGLEYVNLVVGNLVVNTDTTLARNANRVALQEAFNEIPSGAGGIIELKQDYNAGESFVYVDEIGGAPDQGTRRIVLRSGPYQSIYGGWPFIARSETYLDGCAVSISASSDRVRSDLPSRGDVIGRRDIYYMDQSSPTFSVAERRDFTQTVSTTSQTGMYVNVGWVQRNNATDNSAFWLTWNYTKTPLGHNLGVTSSPGGEILNTVPQAGAYIQYETNIANQIADPGYNRSIGSYLPTTIGYSWVPEHGTQVVIGGNTTRVGFHCSCAFYVGPNGDLASVSHNGIVPKTYAGLLIDPNGIAPNGAVIVANGNTRNPAIGNGGVASQAADPGYIIDGQYYFKRGINLTDVVFSAAEQPALMMAEGQNVTIRPSSTSTDVRVFGGAGGSTFISALTDAGRVYICGPNGNRAAISANSSNTSANTFVEFTAGVAKATISTQGTTNADLEIGGGGTGRIVATTLMREKNYAVASLPAVAANIYCRAFVTDSSVAASGNFGAVVAGGGANIVPVYSDGTNWRIG